MATKKEPLAPSNKTVVYTNGNTSDPNYVTGVFGGLNCAGDVVAHFFCEKFPIPDQQVIDESGEVIAEGDSNLFERHISNSIVFNLNFAKCLVDWLETKIKFMEGQKIENS